MGERLEYHIEIPESLRDRPFAPMLLQPLVENAVIHGLEPTIEGGLLRVKASANDDVLTLEVADTGKGMSPNRQPGLGLTNVKERITHLFGNRGQLRIKDNQPTGVRVMIEVPLPHQSIDPNTSERYDA